jgi:SAM-dependent methyltransferase
MQDDHYRGRIAEWYDDWLGDSGDDVDFYVSYFEGFEGRVLELACGTGRILLPIFQSSVRIDGLDSSSEMLAILGGKAERQGIEDIKTICRSMDDFTLETKYDAMFIAGGSFQLLASKDRAANSLGCIRQHLSKDGFLVLDVFIPWGEIRLQKHTSYHVTRDVSRPDGSRSIVQERFEVDLQEQTKRGTYRYEFYQEGRLIETIVDELDIRWYWKDELSVLLREAGFSVVEPLENSLLYKEGEAFVYKAHR